MPIRVLLAGSVLQQSHHAGHVCAFGQWAEGLRSLGCDTVFVDQYAPGDPPIDGIHRVFVEDEGIAILDSDGSVLRGRRDDLRSADLLINVMGFLDQKRTDTTARKRVFLDIDPGFGQMWKALALADIFADHDAYLTIGLTLNTSAVPLCGIDWMPTLPPVYLRQWPVAPPAPKAPITSVVSWRGPFAPIEYEGVTYGMRVHEFRKFFGLPQRVCEHFELALDIDPADEKDRQALLGHGWGLVDPRVVAGTPDAYRDYISRSKAEFMVAKNLYVATQGGWFSDRSACYLATGRPVIAQDTGFSKVLPTGDGLLTFTTLEEAEAAIEDLNARYFEHCEAARWLAEEYLSTNVVLPKLLDAVL